MTIMNGTEAFDIYVWDEKKKKEVKSFTKEVYSNLKKQKKLT